MASHSKLYHPLRSLASTRASTPEYCLRCPLFKSKDSIRENLADRQLSLTIIVIATLYSYLLHYISQYNLHLAYTIQSNANPSSRRESVAVGLGRRESLIPPIPNGYSAIEQGGNRLGM